MTHHTMVRGLKLVQRIDWLRENWGWFGSPAELEACEDVPELKLTREDLTAFATTSCLPDLWAFRAWCWQRLIPTRTADWFWYNHTGERS